MGKFFVHIYDFFERRRSLLWITLVVIVGLMTFFALKMRYNEQITTFFNDDKSGKQQAMIFDHLKVMDRVVVMFSSSNAEESIACGDEFETRLMSGEGAKYINSITSTIGGEQITNTIDIIYENLPVYVTDTDYVRLDSLLEGSGVEQSIAESYVRLSSPMGMALRDITLQDPLGIGVGKFGELQKLSSMSDYEIYDDHIFSSDMSVMMMIIEPKHAIGDTKVNEILVSAIEQCAKETTEEAFDKVEIEYIGGPIVSVNNAQRIKADSFLTLSIALIITIIFILLAFRNRWAIVLRIPRSCCAVCPGGNMVDGAAYYFGNRYRCGSGSTRNCVELLDSRYIAR